MTTADAGLLRAIIEDPHDVGLRLIYADWLEEHGEEERSEFVRVQCELASGSLDPLPRKPVGVGGYHVPRPEAVRRKTRRNALRRREHELLEVHGFAWFREAFGYAGIGWPYNGPVSRNDLAFTTGKLADQALLRDCLFRRGFVEVVSCRRAGWMAHGPAIILAQPVLMVRLTDRPAVSDWNLPYDVLEPVAWARHKAGLPPLEKPHE